MATIFSVPQYLPDPTSGEVVVGYQVQSSSVVGSPSLLLPDNSFSDLTGSPFVMNTNIIDPDGTVNTWYRVRPVRQVTVGNTTYDLDYLWSKPFQADTRMYDAIFTRALLPTLRFTGLSDQGISQTNGTVLSETTGAGIGQWKFNGVQKRFNLQYVMNDDPIRVLDDACRLVYTPSTGPNAGQQQLLTLNVDYAVDSRAGIVEFATAPLAADYARFEFLRTDFVNQDLLQTLTDAVNAASQYGLNGYQVNTNYNLLTLNQSFKYPDVVQIICKIAMLRMRDGLTEAAMRGTTAWRDGNSSVDPYPSRALEFLSAKVDLNEKAIRREINTFLRSTVLPKGRGEFDVFWDLSQLTPLTSGMFASMPGGSYGTLGAGMGVSFYPWYA